MKNLLLPLCLILSCLPITAQNLDVLPLSGRNELWHSWIMDRGTELWDQRRAEVLASLTTVQDLEARQTSLRDTYRELLGPLPAKTPLSPVIVDTIQMNGYLIEKVLYQSLPNHHVTGNFYIPDSGTAPYPAVLITCGHYPIGKAFEIHQDLGALFATNGIAALVVDPISQGERAQVQHPEFGALLFKGQSGTAAHSRIDVGAVLTGGSVVAYQLWDNHRGIDYLYSRSEVVDTSKIGATGSSGGGSQCMYLSAYDSRIKVAAVNSLLMNEETLFSTIGPQTASQNLSFEGEFGIDHPDYVTMFAPKPYLILAATNDFFDVSATRDTYDEVQDVYATLGVPERVSYFEEDSVHGYLQARREVGVTWFRTWFYNDTTHIQEPVFTHLPYDSLQVTMAGQVVEEFTDEVTTTDLSVAKADSHSQDRTAFWATQSLDSCLTKVRELIRLEAHDAISVDTVETIMRTGYSIHKLSINSGNDVPVPALLFVPDGIQNPASAVLYVDGRGKKQDAAEDGIIENVFVDSGKVVLAIDVRGFGETVDNPGKNESKHGNREHRNAVISLYIGKTLIGQRVEDVMKAIDYLWALNIVDTTDLTLVGLDRAGPVAVHTAALDSRISETVIRKSIDSWLPMVADPSQLHNMTHEIPGALAFYDLPDLVNSVLPKTITYFDDFYTFSTSLGDDLHPVSGQLFQNQPNPASGTTTIRFSISRPGEASIIVFDLNGRESRRLLDPQMMTSGEYTVDMETTGMSAGTYFYQLTIDGEPQATEKMIILQQ